MLELKLRQRRDEYRCPEGGGMSSSLLAKYSIVYYLATCLLPRNDAPDAGPDDVIARGTVPAGRRNVVPISGFGRNLELCPRMLQ